MFCNGNTATVVRRLELDYCVPWFNYVSGGVAKHVKLTTTATGYLVDSGSTWSVSQASGGSASATLAGSGRTQRWFTTHSVTGTASATTITFAFQHQYYLTMNVSSSAAGSVTPGSGWYNKGQTVTIKATAKTGHTFKSWAGTGSGSYAGTSASHTITMNATVTETANFS